MRVFVVLSAMLLTTPALADPATFTLPWTNDVVGSGQPGLQGLPVFLWNGFATTFDATPTLRIDRDVEGGAGIPGYTYKALWALTASGFTSPGYEWTITGEQHNRTRKSTGAQNVAVNGTIWRDPTDNGEPTAPSWALNGNCVDTTGESPPTGACIAIELDLGGLVGPDPYRQRVLSHAGAGGSPGAHAAYGYMVSTGDGVTIDRAFSTANVGSHFGIGLDLAGGSFSGAAILMGPEQWLALDGDVSGNFGHFLGMHNGDFTIMTPFGPVLRFSDDGAARLGRVIQTIPHVPASVNAPCEAGEQAWDAAAIYVCIAPNRWRRAALSDW